MNLLERVRTIRGAEEALGLTFADPGSSEENLPRGAKLLGYSDNTYFCFFRHYEETVFAVNEAGAGWQIRPIAYSFRDFLRLIAACGCAELPARAPYLSEETFSIEQDVQWRKYSPALRVLRDTLGLRPIENPYQYTRMIGQIIDCSRIGRK